MLGLVVLWVWLALLVLWGARGFWWSSGPRGLGGSVGPGGFCGSCGSNSGDLVGLVGLLDFLIVQKSTVTPSSLIVLFQLTRYDWPLIMIMMILMIIQTHMIGLAARWRTCIWSACRKEGRPENPASCK